MCLPTHPLKYTTKSTDERPYSSCFKPLKLITLTWDWNMPTSTHFYLLMLSLLLVICYAYIFSGQATIGGALKFILTFLAVAYSAIYLLK